MHIIYLIASKMVMVVIEEGVYFGCFATFLLVIEMLDERVAPHLVELNYY